MKRLLLILLGFMLGCQWLATGGSESNPDVKHLVIFYTNDEHGWMEPGKDHAGAAALLAGWTGTAGPEVKLSHSLALSGGDMWTGPAISTLSEGRSMVDVMNAMDYKAAALGNHEFDFGLENLRERVSEMRFPLLAANVSYKSGGQRPDFVLPYTIIDVNDVSVGVIGLASIMTPLATRSSIVAGLEFTSYAAALQKFVPLVRAEGAELLIVIAHICRNEMMELVAVASDLGIKLIGGGHCHENFIEKKADVTLIQSGSQWQNYIQVDILFDDRVDSIVQLTSQTYPNTAGFSDTTIAAIVSSWRNELDQALSAVIGYAQSEVAVNSAEMYNMITDSWLFAYPDAQIALTNSGGIRQSIPAGDITIEMIYGLLPFENNILELELRGNELLECFYPSIVAGGISSIKNRILKDGQLISPDSTYRVLINDFIYTHPKMYFSSYDAHAYDLGINYRQPLIDWLKAIKTSKTNPLNNFLDNRSR